MRPTYELTKAFAVLAGGLLLAAGLLAAPAAGAGPVFITGLFGLLVNGWALYAFLRYRQGRQDELLHVLAAAVDAGLPLAPAVRAYQHDRPRPGGVRRAAGVLACVVLPLYAYARIWLGWRSFDRLVTDLARRLERGEPLAAALGNVPGVMFREARLAAAVGESTEALAACLRAANRERWGAAWFEVAPRLMYPFVVLLIVSGIATFLMVAIVPKYKKIFDEFGMPLPPLTRTLIEAAQWLDELAFAVAQLFGLVVVAAVLASSTARWHAPVFGRFYRWGAQALVLRTLGRLLAVAHTVPQAVAFLAGSRDVPAVVRGRLAAVLVGVTRGEPLAAALRGAELLRPTMVPLVRSAEQARTLPWALVELGDHLSGRAFRLARRLSLVVSPLLVVAVGVLVGFIAVAMFLPLIDLLTGLSEW